MNTQANGNSYIWCANKQITFELSVFSSNDDELVVLAYPFFIFILSLVEMAISVSFAIWLMERERERNKGNESNICG